MDSSDTDSDNGPPAPKTKRPVPVKALEALAKARQARAEKKQAELAAKKQTKQTKAAAVEAVDSTKVKNEVHHAPPTVATPAAVPDLSYLKSLEDKIESLSKKVAKPKKKVIVAESDSSSSDEEIVVRKKKVAKEPKVVVEDPTYAAFKQHQLKSIEKEKQMEEKKAERDRLLSLFTR